jgi:hypothetical protein
MKIDEVFPVGGVVVVMAIRRTQAQIESAEATLGDLSKERIQGTSSSG